eukprot:6185815-Pleurochrysis_carterae.AAC.2
MIYLSCGSIPKTIAICRSLTLKCTDRMRNRGTLALQHSPSYGFPACAWPLPPVSTPNRSRPHRCAQPPRLHSSPTIGNWYRIYQSPFSGCTGWSL